MPDRFGIAGLRHTEGPRRLPESGPLTSTLAWVALWLCTKRGRDISDLVDAVQYARGVKSPPFERTPGTLGDYFETADTAEPDGTRICTVDDLLAFRKDG